ncbi:putative quinol monooxygenase [Paenibacillus wulumuqiensis]|uniref:putative quinol monooxygenase n=1 Tax=Paenibacillus wulumuqiensis TaxID=1567107 RepID=UPI00061935F9|nr:putative quinol monooxygenase [Paenibacillus wulumuqiensis]
MSRFGLFGKFTVQENQRDNMVSILLDAAESMKDLQECEIYTISIAENEPNCVYVYEVWSSEQAHQASLQLEATQTLIQQAKPIITGMERISIFHPLGGKGLPSTS